MKNLLSIAMLLLLASCGSSQQQAKSPDSAGAETKASAHKPDTVTKKVKVVDSSTVFKQEYATTHVFSDPKTKDKFTLSLTGKDLLDSKAVLLIKNVQNNVIYEYRFSTIDLLLDPDSRPVSEQKQAINKILTHYFDEENFKSPAIDTKETFNDAFEGPQQEDKADWLKIKANPKSVVFYHREGYEGTAGIAYSPERKKAMIVYYSD